MVKSLKSFKIYILHSQTIAYVPNIVVKYILIQPETEGRRGCYIAKILEFDLEIRPTKLIKGKGLSRFLIESNCKDLGLNLVAYIQYHDQNRRIQPYFDYLQSDWYETLYIFYKIRVVMSACKNQR